MSEEENWGMNRSQHQELSNELKAVREQQAQDRVHVDELDEQVRSNQAALLQAVLERLHAVEKQLQEQRAMLLENTKDTKEVKAVWTNAKIGARIVAFMVGALAGLAATVAWLIEHLPKLRDLLR